VERAEAEAILDGDRETAIALLLRVGELFEANERLEARVGELERRLNRSSRNSSLPPSHDPPSAPPRPRGKGSGRKRGGQHGHEGRYRRLLSPEQVDEIVEHWPDRCRVGPAVSRLPKRLRTRGGRRGLQVGMEVHVDVIGEPVRATPARG